MYILIGDSVPADISCFHYYDKKLALSFIYHLYVEI